MAKSAEPFLDGTYWAMRRRIKGQDLFVSGKSSAAAARKAMDKLVRELESRGKPKGQGPYRTSVAQALQDYGLECLPFLKGAVQEANRINRYLRLAGLATLKVTPHVAPPGLPEQVELPLWQPKGRYFDVTTVPAQAFRVIPRSLTKHREARQVRTCQADIERRRLALMTFADVQPYDVKDLMKAFVNGALTQSTVQNERSVLRRLFYYASNVWCWAAPERNPAIGLELPAFKNDRERVMSETEERQLDMALHDCRNHMVGPTMTLLTETAMRTSEPLSYARWRDVDWDRKVLVLRDSKTSRREVPLSPKALDALRELQTLNPGGPERNIVSITYEALRAAWNRACERAGIEDLRLHDLRHTAATRMALKTGNVFLVQALTGHKTFSQLKRYVNVKAADVVAVMHADEPAPTVEPGFNAAAKSSVTRRLG